MDGGSSVGASTLEEDYLKKTLLGIDTEEKKKSALSKKPGRNGQTSKTQSVRP